MACLWRKNFPADFCVTGSPTQNGLLVITLCTDKVEKDKKIAYGRGREDSAGVIALLRCFAINLIRCR
ncbi:hypothetical protein KCP70_07460 [Salmonella enterica subsp. enterica]|nr:hypothetical protein KCP70_07460 [Salmonella enterica subsp. enterica]